MTHTALTLPLESIFSVANTTALVSWVVLILLPRTRVLRRLVQVLAVGGLCVAYAVLIQLFFLPVPGGSFSSLAAVQRLFAVPESPWQGGSITWPSTSLWVCGLHSALARWVSRVGCGPRCWW